MLHSMNILNHIIPLSQIIRFSNILLIIAVTSAESNSDQDAAALFKSPESRGAEERLQGEYELATHTVKVKRSGMLADVKTLWDLQG